MYAINVYHCKKVKLIINKDSNNPKTMQDFKLMNNKLGKMPINPLIFGVNGQDTL